MSVFSLQRPETSKLQLRLEECSSNNLNVCSCSHHTTVVSDNGLYSTHRFNS